MHRFANLRIWLRIAYSPKGCFAIGGLEEMEASRDPVLRAPVSLAASGWMGDLDMSALRRGHFCDHPNERGLL